VYYAAHKGLVLITKWFFARYPLVNTTDHTCTCRFKWEVNQDGPSDSSQYISCSVNILENKKLNTTKSTFNTADDKRRSAWKLSLGDQSSLYLSYFVYILNPFTADTVKTLHFVILV